MIRRFLEWRRESWRRHRCRQLSNHARHSAAAALEHLQQMEDDLLELRALCPKEGNGRRRILQLTEQELEVALQPLEDLSCRGKKAHPMPGLAELEAEIERKR